MRQLSPILIIVRGALLGVVLFVTYVLVAFLRSFFSRPVLGVFDDVTPLLLMAIVFLVLRSTFSREGTYTLKDLPTTAKLLAPELIAPAVMLGKATVMSITLGGVSSLFAFGFPVRSGVLLTIRDGSALIIGILIGLWLLKVFPFSGKRDHPHNHETPTPIEPY